MSRPEDFDVTSLGNRRYSSPIQFDSKSYQADDYFVSDETRIRMEIVLGPGITGSDRSFELAGPRKHIFFNPEHTTAAIVSCGGLSPGMNNVIRSVFCELFFNYHVKDVWGIRNGFLGLNPASGRNPIALTLDFIQAIDKLGGTALGSSRGSQNVSVMVDTLAARGIDVLFCLGGDGTQRGAQALQEEAARRNLTMAIVGIPKTIDNDIPFVHPSFGYITALEKASEVIRGAHVEARDAVNGIGLVKLMGRHAGFIAAGATVVSQEVNFTLIPEIPFPLEGDGGLLDALERRMRLRGHAVVVVAEGAGQHLMGGGKERYDESGNVLNEDIGVFLKDCILRYFKNKDFPVTLKYLDPSYHIRSVPADVYDRYLCDQMARHAVHAAMAGKTGMYIGFEHEKFVHVPIRAMADRKKRLDVTGDLWRAVLQVTGQPRW